MTVHKFFPAHVVWPGRVEQRRVLVLLVDDGPHAGLHVFAQPGEKPACFAAVDWSATTVPADQYAARSGFDVRLADGSTVVVTASQGCRCGQLGHWQGPSWARPAGIPA